MSPPFAYFTCYSSSGSRIVGTGSALLPVPLCSAYENPRASKNNVGQELSLE